MRATSELRSPLLPAMALAGAALFLGDGSDDGRLAWIGAAAVLLAFVLAATRPLPQRLRVLAPLAALAAWSGISVSWSVWPDRSWEYANRGVVYLAFALVGAFLAARVRALFFGMAVLLGAVCAWALAGKVLPWLYEDYERISRLRGPVGYWNALALLGAIALPVGLCLATRWRMRGTLLVFGWLVAIPLTYSRGGILVAVLAVIAWIALSRAWIDAVTTLVAAGIPAAVVVGVAFLLPGITSDGQPHAVRVQDGIVFGLVLLAGLGVAALLARVPPPDPVPAVRRAALGLAAVLALAAAVLVAVNAGALWDGFTGSSATELPNTKGRLVEAGSNYRLDWWKHAWSGFEEHPVRGTGAGSFHFTNLRHRTTSLDVAQEPHNLPIQFLSELGIVGFALFGAAVLALVVSARRRPGPQLALALALPAYLVHGLVDIGWDFVAVSGPVFLVAGALAVPREPDGRLSPPALLMGGGVVFAVLSSFAAVWLGDRWTGEAREAIDRPARAIELAQRARSVNPVAVEPILVQALAEQARRRYGEALGLLQEATRVQPENAEAWYRLGFFDYRIRRCPRTALPELDRFTALDPQNPNNREYDRALREVNSGKPIC